MPYSPALLTSIAALLGASALGCAADVEPPSRAEVAASAATTALIVLHQVHGVEGVRTEVSARFVTVAEGLVDERSLRLAGAEPLPDMGCGVITTSHLPAAPARPIVLLDQGDLIVTRPTGMIALTPREIPDPVGIVAGVAYIGRSFDDTPSAPAGRFSIASADQKVAIQADAPPPLSQLRIGSEEARDNDIVVLPEHITADEISFEATWQASTRNDLVVFDFSRIDGDSIRCAFGDRGQARIALPSATYTQMTTRRIHHETTTSETMQTDVRADTVRAYRIYR